MNLSPGEYIVKMKHYENQAPNRFVAEIIAPGTADDGKGVPIVFHEITTQIPFGKKLGEQNAD